MTKAPTQIEQMLIDLGPARNRAEEILIARMHWLVKVEVSDPVAWAKAYTMMIAIFTYREHGAAPVIECR